MLYVLLEQKFSKLNKLFENLFCHSIKEVFCFCINKENKRGFLKMISFKEWLLEQELNEATKVDIKSTTIRSVKDDHPIDDSNSLFDKKKFNDLKKQLAKSINRNLSSYTEYIEDCLQSCLNPKYFTLSTIHDEHDFHYQGTIEYNHNQYLVFKANFDKTMLYDNATVWVCHDFHDDALFDELKAKNPVGTIFAVQHGYNMVIYDFYKIAKYDKHSVTIEKLVKDSVNANKQGGYYYVKPTKKVESSKKYRIQKIERDPFVNLGDYEGHIYFSKDEYKYNPKHSYLEDHND